jgi:hypothetical protein
MRSIAYTLALFCICFFTNFHLKGQNISVYPNPFSDTLWIEFTNLNHDTVSLICYNIYGEIEATLYDQELVNGNINIAWAPDSLETGTYLLAASINGDQKVQRVSKDYYSSVNEIPQSRFRIFPNPATRFFSIESDETIENIVILDLQGKLVTQFNARSLKTYDIGNLHKGIYILEIQSKSGTHQSTLIKQ